MHQTVTENGIANKNILVALTTGQLYSLDMRQIHSRRPVSEPSLPEKEEGLTQYSPFVWLNPLSFVTLDESVRGSEIGGKTVLASSSTRLESTSLVFSAWGLDAYFNRVTPSQGFDSLASDFNYTLLVLILGALTGAVYIARGAVERKKLQSTWA